MTRSHRLGVLLALLCLLILGAMPVLANARPAGSDGLAFSIWMTFWQFVSALPLLLLERSASARPKMADLSRRTRGRLGAIALATGAMFALSTYLYVITADKAGPVSMVIALQAYPLFAMLLEAAFQGKRKSLAEIGFTLIMIGALVYLATGGTFRAADVSWWSVLALAIPLLWSIAHIQLKSILETMPVTPSQVTVSRLLISGFILLVAQAVLGQTGLLVAAAGDMPFQRAAVILGVAYYLELVLWFYAMRHIDVSLASSLTVPAPAVTMLVSVAVLGETVARYQIVAMVVVTLAMYGLLLSGRPRR